MHFLLRFFEKTALLLCGKGTFPNNVCQPHLGVEGPPVKEANGNSEKPSSFVSSDSAPDMQGVRGGWRRARGPAPRESLQG